MKKISSWQTRHQKQEKRRKKIFVLKILFIIFLTILVGFLGKIYFSISRSLWDGKNQFNLALAGKPVLLLSFNPQEKSLAIISIPEGTFIEAIHGYGPCRVEALYLLGELNGKGGEIFQGSLQEYLGIPIDGYAVIPNLQFSNANFAKEIKNLLPSVLLKLVKGGKSNLTKWDLIRLWQNLKGLRQDKITLVDLGQTRASQEIELPDGSKAKKIETERLQSVMDDFFVDPQIKNEGLTVAVLNATDHFGLANKAASLIENSGGQVVSVGEMEMSDDDKVKNSKCEIRSQKSKKKTYTVQKLTKIFGCQWGGENLENQRADIVLILGEGYWKELNLP
jgi:hypothetical protein